jgi:ParB/RepB/Spo0J family partition protein
MSMSRKNDAVAVEPEPIEIFKDWPFAEEKTEQVLLEYIESSPTNPRQAFPEEHIAGLAANIREQGLIQPIVIRPLYAVTATLSDGSHTFTIASEQGAQKWIAAMSAQLVGRTVTKLRVDDNPSQYEIVAGECRWRAYKLLMDTDGPKYGYILASVRNLSDDQVREIQLSENTHRKDLSPLELARTYNELVEIERGKGTFNPMQVVADRLGISKSVVAQTIQTLKAIPEVHRALELELITKSHAIDCQRLDPDEQREYLCECLLGYYDAIDLGDVLADQSTYDRALIEAKSVAAMRQWLNRELVAKTPDANVEDAQESDEEAVEEDEEPTDSPLFGEPLGTPAVRDSEPARPQPTQQSSKTRPTLADSLPSEEEIREREIRTEAMHQAVHKIMDGIANTAGKRRQAMNSDDLVQVGLAFYFMLPMELRSVVSQESGWAPLAIREQLEECNTAARGQFLVLCSLAVNLQHGQRGEFFDEFAERYNVVLDKIAAKLRSAREKAEKKVGRK